MHNVEMQFSFEPALGHRLHYYQSAMDAASSKSGMDYEEIPDSCTVFLCLDGPFGKGIPVCTIRLSSHGWPMPC